MSVFADTGVFLAYRNKKIRLEKEESFRVKNSALLSTDFSIILHQLND